MRQLGARHCRTTDYLILARMAKQIEKTFGHPVDLEWLYDNRGLWLLQARPISGLTRSPQLTNDDCEWSRANFKETMPELPSPLGLSFLEQFMERYIFHPIGVMGCQNSQKGSPRSARSGDVPISI